MQILKNVLYATGFIALPFFAGNALAQAEQPNQTITRDADHKMMKGSSDYFTGDVSVKILFGPKEGAQYSAGEVTFQPGARSNWHTHPAGQNIIITKGVGLTGTEDGTVVEIHEGDVIWCPPGVKHWHGASSDSAMTHMTITGEKEGNVTWMEPVTDAQYNKNSSHENE